MKSKSGVWKRQSFSLCPRVDLLPQLAPDRTADVILPLSSPLPADILLGEGSIDEGEWATGNGWAAAGMVRVLACALISRPVTACSD